VEFRFFLQISKYDNDVIQDGSIGTLSTGVVPQKWFINQDDFSKDYVVVDSLRLLSKETVPQKS
jgi:hypothetical protein